MHMQRGFAMGLRLAVVSLGMVVLGMLSSCGGGGGGGGAAAPVVNANPTGYYDTGTLNLVDSSNKALPPITDLQGIIYNNRVMLFSMASGYSFDGTFTVTENSFTGTVTTFFNGYNAVSVAVSGSINQGSTLSGSFASNGTVSGTFSLHYSSTNNQVADVSRVINVDSTHNWVGNIPEASTPVEMNFVPSNIAGVLSFSNTFIWPIDGFFSSCAPGTGPLGMNNPDLFVAISGTNLYRMANDAIGLCDVNTVINSSDYSGFATTLSAAKPDDTLVFMLSNGKYHYYSVFTKVF